MRKKRANQQQSENSVLILFFNLSEALKHLYNWFHETIYEMASRLTDLSFDPASAADALHSLTIGSIRPVMNKPQEHRIFKCFSSKSNFTQTT